MSVASRALLPEPPPKDVQATFCATLVDEWVRGGACAAVLCPGSRSTPMAMALAKDGRIPLHIRLDERSAGFVALGMALSAGAPVVLCTTSGTAAAELHPAVVEAHLARVPLLVCTADRPPELQRVGAPQTIDQTNLYGTATRWHADPGVPQWSTREVWRSLAARALAEASCGPLGPGPVHLNLPMREPLVGEIGPLPPGRAGGKSWHQVTDTKGQSASGAILPAGDAAGAAGLGGLPGRRGIVVAGAGAGDPEEVFALADALGWPVLADLRSGCRVTRDGVVVAADGILRCEAAIEHLRPEVVLRLGSPWASKVLNSWIDSLAVDGVRQVQIDPWWRWADPGHTLTDLVVADPGAWCRQAVQALGVPALGTQSTQVVGEDWRNLWATADQVAQEAIEAWCVSHPEATEPGVARAVLRSVVPGSTLVVSSSMPVRDAEWFGPVLSCPPRVLANRGANGIDGVVSTAMGAALAGDRRVVALVGDLAFLHDLTALVLPVDVQVSCTIVVVDNAGGGIVSFLPQVGDLEPFEFESLFGTPQRVDVESAARGLGVDVVSVDRIDALVEALSAASEHSSISVIRVRVPDRATNALLHDELNSLVSKAVGSVVRRAVAG